MNMQQKANWLLVLTAMIWGMGFVAGKMALTGFTPFSIMLWRYAITALILLIFFHRRILRADRRLILFGILIGVMVVISIAVQLIGLQYTTSAKQSFLCPAYSIMTPFLSWLILRKRPAWIHFFTAALSLTGIGIITLQGDAFTISLGDSLSLLFALLYALQIVLIGKYMTPETDSWAFTFYQMFTAAVLSGILVLWHHDPIIGTGTEGWIGLLYLGVLNSFVALSVQNYAQKFAKDTTAALILCLESVFGFLFSSLYYSGDFSLRILFGGAICIGAVLINTRFGSDQPE